MHRMNWPEKVCNLSVFKLILIHQVVSRKYLPRASYLGPNSKLAQYRHWIPALNPIACHKCAIKHVYGNLREGSASTGTVGWVLLPGDETASGGLGDDGMRVRGGTGTERDGTGGVLFLNLVSGHKAQHNVSLVCASKIPGKVLRRPIEELGDFPKETSGCFLMRMGYSHLDPTCPAGTRKLRIQSHTYHIMHYGVHSI